MIFKTLIVQINTFSTSWLRNIEERRENVLLLFRFWSGLVTETKIQQ